MKLKFSQFIFYICLAPFISSCLILQKEPFQQFPDKNEMDFKSNDIVKNKKVFLETNAQIIWHQKRNKDLEKQLNDHMMEKMKEIKYGFIVSKKEDADFIVSLNDNMEAEFSLTLGIISNLTLFIVPCYTHSKSNIELTVTNIKNGQTKKFDYPEVDTTIIDEILLLPLAPVYFYDLHKSNQNFKNFLYTIKEDPIFQEPVERKPNIS